MTKDRGSDPASLTDEEWRQRLSPEQYAVCRQGGTEPPFSGDYLGGGKAGTFVCVCCAAPLFSSADKYDSGSGWPSFTRPVAPGALSEHVDTRAGMRRTEVRCACCDAHLGHVFPDGPPPGGLRYCINSVALLLQHHAP